MEDGTKVRDCKKLYIETINCGSCKLLAHKLTRNWIVDYNLYLHLMENEKTEIKNIRLRWDK